MKFTMGVAIIVLSAVVVSIGSAQTSPSPAGSLVPTIEAARKTDGATVVKKNTDGSSLLVTTTHGAVASYRLKNANGKTAALTPIAVAGPGFVCSVNGGQKCYYCTMSGTTMNCMEVVCATASVEFVKE